MASKRVFIILSICFCALLAEPRGRGWGPDFCVCEVGAGLCGERGAHLFDGYGGEVGGGEDGVDDWDVLFLVGIRNRGMGEEGRGCAHFGDLGLGDLKEGLEM